MAGGRTPETRLQFTGGFAFSTVRTKVMVDPASNLHRRRIPLHGEDHIKDRVRFHGLRGGDSSRVRQSLERPRPIGGTGIRSEAWP